MQAIITKYIGPSNVRGSRIKATAQAGSVTIGYRYELNTEENHRAAAEKLAARYGWEWCHVSGQLPNHDYCHVSTK